MDFIFAGSNSCNDNFAVIVIKRSLCINLIGLGLAYIICVSDIANLIFHRSNLCNDDVGVIILKSSLWINLVGLRPAYTNCITKIVNLIFLREVRQLSVN